ncbi:LOW QUALITY PROTEIN: hypothetical protein E2986_03106 [Frieseomelitta varia]|uniref:Methyltransferase NSUN7 n=1 Tax=Frieseomelitta varia TaxID=561572 RepID=A0A833W4F6_9HYME|nr:LOW QUALITY PROTEIN: hypothetical protein E2986_03106 [Frieseomelitta varia]
MITRCLKTMTKPSVSARKRSTFEDYAKIFRALLASWRENYNRLCNDEFCENFEDLTLPSNEDWRYRIYYRLVQLQREYDVNSAKRRDVEETGSGKETETETRPQVERKKKNDWEWEPKRQGHDLKAKPRKCQNEEPRGSLMSVGRIGGSMIETCVEPGWRVNDILLAAVVLRRVQPASEYSDEAEMRRVFGLVYDVLRYKKIFIRALEDTGFWRRNAAIKNQEKIVWLLLYDMQGRKFATEIANLEERERMFEEAGLTDIENALLDVKTHLAASISRLRIGGSALNLGEYFFSDRPSVETVYLANENEKKKTNAVRMYAYVGAYLPNPKDELLPGRLRVIEGVAWGARARIATGWINTTRVVGRKEFLEEMSKLKLIHRECGANQTIELEEHEFTFDPICPKVVHLHEGMRETLATSALIRDHRFVFLEKSLCMGAAALVQAIRVGRFYGPVILTHSLAPRHTGYLAGLLADIEHAGKLLVYGAGDRLCEYETYLKDLGVTLQRCRVSSQKYVSHPATSESERATVVLAMPSCTYTGVRDIVDLAVARGGDMDLLESLTDSYANSVYDDSDNDNDNDNNNQKSNHRKSYDHEQWRSFLTDQMSTLKYTLTRPNVQFVVYEVHTILPSETTEMIREVVDCVNRMAVEKYIREHPVQSESRDSDLFEVGSIDDIYGENVSRMLDPGCFLAVIKRKEIVQFDSLFMIKVAESKGLFGDPNKVQRQSKHESVVDRSIRQSSQTSARKRSKRAKNPSLLVLPT